MNRCRGVINSAYLEISCQHKRKKKIRASFSSFFMSQALQKDFQRKSGFVGSDHYLNISHHCFRRKKNHQHLQIQMFLRLFKQAKDSHGSSCLMRTRGDY